MSDPAPPRPDSPPPTPLPRPGRHDGPPARPQRRLGRDRRGPAPAGAGADGPAARLAGALMSDHTTRLRRLARQTTRSLRPPRRSRPRSPAWPWSSPWRRSPASSSRPFPPPPRAPRSPAIAAAIEFPVYAILLGLLGNLALTRLGLRDRLAGGFRTEFFIKTGLVLLGASINFAVILTAAGPAILQALVLISVVFGFTWWLGGRLGLDDRLRALLSSAVSICGISARASRAGRAARDRPGQREQLAYTASLVVVFALPVDLPAARGGERAAGSRRPSPAPGSAATSTPRRR